ncbi:Hypothetical predicted protein [Pelobates cultripes]|uniref:Endonuclease/exonuclease/phosphatase domain-containing protein n=1 Tax=Pelobates cultripes TaxID=61616 RepID=A0AAD1SRS8_PELCU|nr:Hypothetical predicted protein [Pelobates cultripes]
MYTFATIYTPNTGQASFIRRTLTKLARFTEGILVFGGDFNIPLDPLIDTSTGRSSIPHSAIRTVHKALRDLRLVDSWRARHPDDRDYAYYSTIHKRYSRIDYVFIQQEGLTYMQRADIHTTPWSDHSAAQVTMTSPMFRPTRTAWRLNDSLLMDKILKTQLEEHLQQYFAENNTEEVSDMTIWEAHKSVIRGHLIRMASRRKKEIGQQLADLTQKISDLEMAHKRDQQDQTYRDLMSNRRHFSELIESKHTRTIRRTRAFFYMHANKGGKLLARMLRGTQSRAQVHALRTTQGTLTQFPEEIASEFQRFYTQLYNTRGVDDGTSQTTRKAETTDYLGGLNRTPSHQRKQRN